MADEKIKQLLKEVRQGKKVPNLSVQNVLPNFIEVEFGEKIRAITNSQERQQYRDSLTSYYASGAGRATIEAIISDMEYQYARALSILTGVTVPGGGGGGTSFLKKLTDIYHDDTGILRADGTAVQNGDILTYDSANKIWNAAANNTVEVTSHATAVAQSLIATIKVGGVSTAIYNGVRWGTYDSSTHTIPVTINGTTRILCVDGYGYIGMTAIQSTSQQQALFGIASINATESASSSSRIIWDSANNAWHFIGNVYADGWIAAGGIGTESSGGVSFLKELTDIYHNENGILRSDGSAVQNGDVLVYDSTNARWRAAAQSGEGGSTVSWGTESGGTIPLTVDGTTKTLLLSGALDGYLPLTGGTLTGDLRLKNTGNYGLAINFGDGNYVYLKEATDDVLSIYARNGISLSASGASSKFEWDSDNNAWHFHGNVYADGWMAAGGIGSGSSGGSNVSISNLLSSGTRIATITINGTDYDILAPSGGSGGSAVSWGAQSGNTIPLSVDGVSKTLLLSDALSSYVTLSTAQTITGAKTFSTNPLTIASSSGISVNAASYIDIGDARLEYDSGAKAIHVTYRSGSGQTIGLFADGFLAAGGVAGQSNVKFVTLDGDQIIEGEKTFTDYTEFSSSLQITGENITSGSLLYVNGLTTIGGDISLTGTLNGISVSKDSYGYGDISIGSRLYIQTNSNDLLLGSGSGKVIVGSHPGGTAIGSNKFYVGGTAIATSWNTISDRRLKDEISLLQKDEAIEKLMALAPSTWKWNSGSEKGKMASGFIAQEMEDVLPFMVFGEDYKGVAYQMLHAYEVSAIQSHEERIRVLEKENAMLRDMINTIRA